MFDSIKCLDGGYVRFVEAWGHGDAGIPDRNVDSTDVGKPLRALVESETDYECGIIEAARQSTQASFRGWSPYQYCEHCDTIVNCNFLDFIEHNQPQCANPNGHDWRNFPKGDAGLHKYLFSGKPQHATPFEFSGAIIEVQAPIFVFREWHRHRTQSYNEMSARYAPLPNNNYMPTVERCLMVNATNKQAGAIKDSVEVTHESALDWLSDLNLLYGHAEECYQKGLRRGIPKEVARVCLPVGRYSRMRASTSLRNWLAFMTLRADPAAQWEIQQYANAVGQILEAKFPKTWGLYVDRKM